MNGSARGTAVVLLAVLGLVAEAGARGVAARQGGLGRCSDGGAAHPVEHPPVGIIGTSGDGRGHPAPVGPSRHGGAPAPEEFIERE